MTDSESRNIEQCTTCYQSGYGYEIKEVWFNTDALPPQLVLTSLKVIKFAPWDQADD